MTGLLFQTISDFLKAFGYVSAARNFSDKSFFLQIPPLCQGDTKHQQPFSYLAKTLWNTTLEEEQQKEEEEGRMHLDEKMNISSLFF